MNDDQKPPKNEESGTTDPWTENLAVSANESDSDRGAPADEKVDGGSVQAPGWEREVLNRLAFASLNEQRRARRWGVFFKSLTFGYLFLVLLMLLNLPGDDTDLGVAVGGDYTALIEIDGVIASDTPNNADNIVSALRAAFKDKHAKGIILRINSPGGSPVQAGYIYDEIIRLRAENPETPLYSVAMEVCASAAYYIAAASQEIYADKASMVGSIGVLIDTFGFTEAIKKLGIERRLLTAGESKGFLDPFSPLKPADKVHVQEMLDTVHQQFVEAVKKGRGDRLNQDKKLFTGLAWSGEQSLGLGLVDGLGSSSYVARELIGAERIRDFTPRENYLDRFARRIGSAMADTLFQMMTAMQIR